MENIAPLGWKLLRSTLNTSSRLSRCELLLAYTHLILLHDGFQCIGTEGNETDPCERLPDRWESSVMLYQHMDSISRFQLHHFDVGEAKLLLVLHRLDRSNDTKSLILDMYLHLNENDEILSYDILSKAIRDKLALTFDQERF